MHKFDEDLDQGLTDAATVLAARRDVDPLLANLIVQPLDPVQVQALTRWLVEVYPAASEAFARLQEDGRRGPFCSSIPGTGPVAPVAGACPPSRALTVVSDR